MPSESDKPPVDGSRHQDTRMIAVKELSGMNEAQAYEAGREAFERKDDRLSCPVPAPYYPPRSPADAGADVASGLTAGAFWLDGYDAASRMVEQ